MKEQCKNCKYWKTNQKDFLFSSEIGYCIAMPSSNIKERCGYVFTDSPDVNIDNNCVKLQPFGRAGIENNPVMFVTTKNFGCSNFIE
ncbi:MAG: hypothetical protein R6U85_10280 [Salinivirgaceae bacterium]